MNEQKATRGSGREQNLPRERYFSDSYFSLKQVCSFAHQISDIFALQKTKILEVGIGNGFVSTFLKRAGLQIITVDINPSLEPDIVCPIHDLPRVLNGDQFDLVVCCEVLEHMPFTDFEESLAILRGASQNLYLTLPNWRTAYGFGGFLQLPKVCPRFSQFYVELQRRKHLPDEHFWEVGFSPETSKKRIRRLLEQRYSSVTCRRYCLNPYHISFTCTSH